MMMYVYVLVSIFLIIYFALIVWMFLRRRKGGLTAKNQQYVHSHWYRILDSFENDPKHSLMDADKLLDFCLAKKGGKKFERLSLGEKLKKGRDLFSDLDGVWFAHKLRNKIAHELNFKISRGDAKRALSSFKRALTDLGAKL